MLLAEVVYYINTCKIFCIFGLKEQRKYCFSLSWFCEANFYFAHLRERGIEKLLMTIAYV